MRLLKDTVALFSIAVLLVIGSIGVMAMSGHHHEPGCPFMPGEQTICQMDVFDHLILWQSVFTTILPTVISLILLAVAVFVSWRCYRLPDLSMRPMRPAFSKQRLQPERARVIQELLTSGIRNPRAP